MLSVFYGKTQVNGQRLEKIKVVNQPSINIRGEKETYYTLIISDPDASSADFLHWLVMNINKDRYQEILSYKSPNPVSGSHRYNLYLLEQDGKILLEPFDRNDFNVSDFISRYGLDFKDTQFFSVKA